MYNPWTATIWCEKSLKQKLNTIDQFFNLENILNNTTKTKSLLFPKTEEEAVDLVYNVEKLDYSIKKLEIEENQKEALNTTSIILSRALMFSRAKYFKAPYKIFRNNTQDLTPEQIAGFIKEGYLLMNTFGNKEEQEVYTNLLRIKELIENTNMKNVIYTNFFKRITHYISNEDDCVEDIKNFNEKFQIMHGLQEPTLLEFGLWCSILWVTKGKPLDQFIKLTKSA